MFRTKKTMRRELLRALRENDYLKNDRKRHRETVEGYRQLIKIYEALVLYLGEKLEPGIKTGDFRERSKKIISILEGEAHESSKE